MCRIATLVATALLAVCSGAIASKLSPGHDAALAHFKAGKEPTAKDAVWATPDSFKVAVIDDKTSRDGYAAYVCQVLSGYISDTSNITVRVVDAVALVRRNEWRTIGTAYCKKK